MYKSPIRKALKNVVSAATAFASKTCRPKVGIEQARYKKAQSTQNALTSTDFGRMKEVNDAGNALISEESFQSAPIEERQRKVKKLLDRMVERGLVKRGTVRWNNIQQIVTFHYACGVIGGFVVKSQVEKTKNPNRRD